MYENIPSIDNKTHTFGKGFFSIKSICEGYIGNGTYILIFEEHRDGDGDMAHLEVEYHLDEQKFTYEDVWDYDHKATTNIPNKLKSEIEEYILTRCGLVKGMLLKEKLALEITLDIDKNTTIGEINEFIKKIVIESVKYPEVENITPIDLKLVGRL